MRRVVILGLVWLLLGFSRSVSAAPLAVGGVVPKLSAKDQHGAAYTFTNGTTHLLVAVEMDVAKVANQKLAAEGAGFLEKHQAAYLMDIHPMPGIARVFALPKMRKYPHRIVLIETKGALDWVPTQPGRIAVLKLTSEGRIENISQWNPVDSPAGSIFQ